ncbi:hypothetical protein H2198_000054 [Neophaeococcomyces mojaviensis]|uniref:Uncharacterized protein n=1 Tax=Neophaeococcomyces mojaviensis TaxID=3383035 RepID=A0ACC3AKY6_9EURO|nr:hypothetical protein H2198_000054 [Knufia sp. JES_112]
MAPTKRSRPAFSPPRPGKSKSDLKTSNGTTSRRKTTSTSTSKKSSSRPTPNNSRKRARKTLSPDEDEEDEEDRHAGRSALALVDMQAGEDDDDDDEDEEEEEDIVDDEKNNDDVAESPSESEPEMILAEITTSSEPSTAPIPEALVHKLLQHHFEKPATKLSADARTVVGRYLEVFVREAIMRSAFEREQREGGVDGAGGGGGGFLEVEDLERSAVQLCLDF